MSTALVYYAMCSVVLFVKMLAVSNYQAYHRLRRSTFTNPEDARVFGHGAAAAAELPQVQRAANVWRNDVENIPIFLALGIAYVMVGAWDAGAAYYFTTFTVARILHTLAYLNGLQPWRTITYMVGVTVCVVMCIHIVAAVM